MTRERLARVALRAYPPQVREADGNEMLGTLLDLSDGSTPVLLRETWLLVLAGLRRRAHTTAALGIRRLGADAACVAATLWGLSVLWFTASRIVAGYPAEAALWWNAGVVVPVTLALLGCDRLAGVCGLIWTALFEVFAYPHASGRVMALVLIGRLLPIACYTVMVLAPRARGFDPRRPLWLVGVISMAVVWALMSGRGLLAGGEVDIQIVALLGLSLVGLARWPVNPVLAIACGIVWTAIGLAFLDPWLTPPGPVPWIEAAAAPIVLAGSLFRLRAVTHRTSR